VSATVDIDIVAEAVSINVAVAAVVEDKLLEAAPRERDMELVVLGRWGCWRAETPTCSSRTPARRKRKHKMVLKVIIVCLSSTVW
jgi:hypothetical protein